MWGDNNMNTNSSEIALNKLIILLIFKEIEIPLTVAQITDIVLQNNLINYFDLQQCLQELEETNMIVRLENKQAFTITEMGIKTVSVFINRIPGDTYELIKKYALQNKDIIRLETQVFANYIKKSETEYIVTLKVIEKDITLIEINLNVVSANQAKLICKKWKESYYQVYDQIVNTLIK